MPDNFLCSSAEGGCGLPNCLSCIRQAHCGIIICYGGGSRGGQPQTKAYGPRPSPSQEHLPAHGQCELGFVKHFGVVLY